MSPNTCFCALCPQRLLGEGKLSVRVHRMPSPGTCVSHPTRTDAADSTLWTGAEDQDQRTCKTEQIGLREQPGVHPHFSGRLGRVSVLPSCPALWLFGGGTGRERCQLRPDSAPRQKRNPSAAKSRSPQQCFSHDHVRFPERAPTSFKRHSLSRAPEGPDHRGFLSVRPSVRPGRGALMFACACGEDEEGRSLRRNDQLEGPAVSRSPGEGCSPRSQR